MKKYFLTLTCVCVLSTCIFAQHTIQWQRTLGGSLYDEVQDIISVADGNYLVLGVTASSNYDIFGYHGGYDIFVAKFGPAGNTIWKKTFGGTDVETPGTILSTEDGGCIVAGITRSDNYDVVGFHGGLSDGWMFKLNSSGNMEWQKVFGGIGMEELNCMIVTSDGGYLLTGASTIPDGDVTENLGGLDFWVIKTDDKGEIVWQHSYGGSNEDIAYHASETSDGGYIVVGNTFSNDGYVTNNKGNVDIWVMKINADGIFEWGTALGGEYAELGRFVHETEGGYIAGGLTGTKNNGDVVGGHGLYDMWVVKIDLSGNLVWQLPIGGTELDKTSQMELLADGSCILIGETRSNDGDFSNNDGGADFALVKISPDGELVWQQTFGGTKPDSGYAIERTPDNGYIIGGHTWSTNGDLEGFTNRGKSDFWILKLSPETTNATLDTKTEPVLLYPNPTADVVNLSVPEPFSELQIMITDASGITVLQKDVINGGAVSLAGLPAGIYTFHARMPDGRVRTGRLAKY